MQKDYPKLPGIYKIINTKNNKCYIGSAVNLYKRINRHFYELKKQCHNNKHLQRAYNKYKKESFNVEILEKFKEINYKKLLLIEENYIKKYNCLEKGYNLLLNNSDHFTKINKSEKHIQNNVKKQSISVMCFDRFNGKFYKEFDSVANASRFFKTSSSNISRACQGEFNHIKNYVFCYKKDYDKNKDYSFANHWSKNKKLSENHIKKLRESVSKAKGRKIYKYDLNFNLIEIYNSRLEAERKNNIKREKLRTIAGKETPFEGYYWFYNKI